MFGVLGVALCALLFWNPKLATDRPRRVIIYLPVTRDSSLMVIGWVHPHRVASAFTEQSTAVLTQVSEQVLALHATTPSGTSRASLLAPRWR